MWRQAMEDRRIDGGEGTIDFRSVVRRCACEPQIVECFNRTCGASLQAPIESLLTEDGPTGTEDEQFAIGCFILFVHQNIWMRLKTAQQRTGSLTIALQEAIIQPP
jgi:hypothetical protein